MPDLSRFPRREWCRSLESQIRGAATTSLDYGDPTGAAELRAQLAAFVGRSRTVVADPQRTFITAGTTGALMRLGSLLAGAGVRAVAVEEPGYPIGRRVLRAAGLKLRSVPVDQRGIDVRALADTDADAVLLTPAHQFPTGVIVDSHRRKELFEWARSRRALILEDDYDGEYQYGPDRVPALQGEAPDHVVYLGTASKMLSPSLRLGWMVVPERLYQPLEQMGPAREVPVFAQLALAEFIARGELDRHLRRMRRLYRHRHDLMATVIGRELSGVRLHGVAAGLHLLARWRTTVDPQRLRAACRRRGIGLYTFQWSPRAGALEVAMAIGFGNVPDESIEPAIRELAATCRSAAGSAR